LPIVFIQDRNFYPSIGPPPPTNIAPTDTHPQRALLTTWTRFQASWLLSTFESCFFLFWDWLAATSFKWCLLLQTSLNNCVWMDKRHHHSCRVGS